MSKRGKVGQAKHDNKVQQRLDYYKNKDFWVRADLPGRSKPPKVSERIPDIYARKGKKLVVEEVETPNTLKSDKEQQQKLKSGTEKLGGEFKIKIAK